MIFPGNSGIFPDFPDFWGFGARTAQGWDALGWFSRFFGPVLDPWGALSGKFRPDAPKFDLIFELIFLGRTKSGRIP